jgi:hypothetical protein
MTFDSTPSVDNVTSDTHNVTRVTVEPSFLDFPRVAAVVQRMALTGFVQLAKAQARVYVANLRAIEGNTHAVFTKNEARSIMAVLDFERDDKGNNALTIGNTLSYGTSDSKTVKRLKDAVKSGACADVATAIAQGRGKPVKTNADESKNASERINLTDLQYAAVLTALKLDTPARF